ncbi:putative non-specific serine/threonine protein kinase [Helianthus annuus]|nr:putative non-specific serine/threonine protein kinase [Helianthus annuus]
MKEEQVIISASIRRGMLFLNSKHTLIKTPRVFSLVDEEATNDCCSWSGVTCNNHSHATGLDLKGGDLKGKISSSLLNLTYLNNLDLSNNSFHGSSADPASFFTGFLFPNHTRFTLHKTFFSKSYKIYTTKERFFPNRLGSWEPGKPL